MPGDHQNPVDHGRFGRPATGTTRRTLLTGALSSALLAAVSGCSGSSSAAPGGGGAGGDKPSGPTDPDPGLLAGLRSAEEGLIAQYDAAISLFPALAPRLASLRADHAGHLAAAGGTAPSVVPAPTPTDAAVPDVGQALAGLAGAERTAANSRIGDCGNAHGPDLARLLASVGACEAAHGQLLTDLAHTVAATPKKTKSPHPARTSGVVE